MSFSSWLRSLKSALTRSLGGTSVRRARLALEALEDRTVPTSSLAVAGPTWIAENSTYTLLLFSQDPTLTDWTINWGDGNTTVVPGTATTATHAYGAGPLAVNITVTGATAGGTVTATAHAGGGQSLGAFVSGGLDTSMGMTFGPDGSLYVADTNGHSSAVAINRYDTNGNFAGVFVANAGSVVWSMTFGADGHLYATSRDTHEVRRFHGTTGAFIDVFATVDTPCGVVFGPDANFDSMADLYVLSNEAAMVTVFDGGTGSFIKTLSGGISSPFNLAIGPDGAVYVAHYGAGTVARYNETTSTFETFATVGVGQEVTDLEFGSGGDFLYVISRAQSRVWRFNGHTGAFIDVFADQSDELAMPNEIVTDGDGDLYVSNWNTQNVVRLDGPAAGQSSLPVNVLEVFTATYSNATAKAIPDPGVTTSTIAVAHSGSVVDVNVKINISHTFDNDLTVALIAPNGRRIDLTSHNGGSGNDYKNTVFDDEAATSITAGAPPFSGTYRPEWSLAGLDGASVTGTWTLEVRDVVKISKGKLNNWSLTVIRGNSGSPLLAAGEPPPGHPGPPPLTDLALQPLVQEAIDRWSATGLSSEQLAALHNADLRIADLGGSYLGLQSGTTIWLDDDAAGWGWFVDRTPWDDVEFLSPGGMATGRMDLLTTLMHEMGHVLGWDDIYDPVSSGDLMYGYLATGERRAPGVLASAVQADDVFASWGDFDGWLALLLQRKERRP